MSPSSFPFPPPPPPQLRPGWSSWAVVTAILLLLIAFAVYFYAG